ncbi:MAG: transcription termination factor NusA [Malacoplasma sp.]|nr:transcription termination factor NusA [Malacoplasma sp.]
MRIKALSDKLDRIAFEKETSRENIINILKMALEKSYLKDHPDEVIEADVNLEKETIRLFGKKVVVDKSEDEIDDDKEINLKDAQTIKKSYKLDDIVKEEIKVEDFERRIAHHFGQILNHNLSEISNLKVYEAWKDKVGFIIRAEVEKVDKIIEVNLGNTKGVLLHKETLPGEQLIPGQKYLFLIKEVKQQTKGWPIILSRSDERIFRYLLESEITEIADKTIEIKKISRLVGYKTKVAIASTRYGVDAVAIAVGPKGQRIKKISEMLNNEKIDVILYDEDPKQFIVNACFPDSVLGIEISDDEEKKDNKFVTLICDEKNYHRINKLSNLRLLNKLTGWSIDVVNEATAQEDEIKYENISHLVSSKKRQPRKSFANQNRYSGHLNSANQNNNNNFYNNFAMDDIIDSPFNYEQYCADLENITDDDVENLLTNSNKSASKRNKKEFNDEEEVVFVDGAGKKVLEKQQNQDQELNEDENDSVSNYESLADAANQTEAESVSESNQIFSKAEIEEQKQSLYTPKKTNINIDDVGSDSPYFANKKDKKSNTNKINKLSTTPVKKEKKVKENVLAQLLDETDDLNVEDSIDTSNLDNLELEDE